MRRALATVLAALLAGLAALGLIGRGEGTVRVAFRPEQGATYRYEVRISSTSETVLGAAAPARSADDVLLVAEHTVLATGPDGVRVQVVLAEPEGDQRTFEVVFDRAAQLQAIEAIEGVPAEILGELGLASVFPAAAGGPPDRGLAPGDRWEVDDRVALGANPSLTRLTGEGRLVELAVEGGRDVARLRSVTVLPVLTSRSTPQGELLLDGIQRTAQDATHDLADGSIRSATSTTTASYDLTVSPPLGTSATPVTGTLTVTVSAETRRVDL